MREILFEFKLNPLKLWVGVEVCLVEIEVAGDSMSFNFTR